MALDPDTLDEVVGQFFEELAAQPIRKKRTSRAGLVINMDGKTLRGTIPVGSTQGVHLVAAYLPHEGVVLAQLEVAEKGNELVVAPTLLGQLDLRGVVITGDAMFAKRNLSAQIVKGGGDYVWKVKKNQSGLLNDIKTLFNPPPLTQCEAQDFAMPADLGGGVQGGQGAWTQRGARIVGKLRPQRVFGLASYRAGIPGKEANN